MSTISAGLKKFYGDDLRVIRKDYALGQMTPASFKGVPFSVRSENMSDIGRRKIIHEFPDKKGVFVEDLGELSPTISIPAFVFGIDWLENMNRLETALKESSAGKLEIPTFGISEEAFALSYRKTAAQTAIGEVTFQLEFIIGTNKGGPFKTIAITETMYEVADNTREKFIEAFSEENNFWVEVNDAISIISDKITLLELINKTIIGIESKIQSEVSDVLQYVDNLEKTINSLIQNPVNLANSLFSIVTSLPGFFKQLSFGLPSNGGALFEMLDLTSSLGSGDFFVNDDIKGDSTINDLISLETTAIPLWPKTTDPRIKRNINRLTLTQSFRINCLIIAYEQASIKVYSTTIELQQVREALETAYAQIMQNDIQNHNAIQNYEEIRSNIDNLKSITLQILEEKEQQASLIETISRINGVSASILTYNLYAEDFSTEEELTTRTIELRELNSEQKTVYLKGDVDVIREQ